MSKLGPVSQAILEYVQSKTGYIQIFRMVHAVSRRTGESHSSKWYFRQLTCLVLEGRIEAKVSRTGDKVAFKFRRLQENGLEGLQEIEDKVDD